MGTIAKRILRRRNSCGRGSAEEAQVGARGVIRLERVYLLTHYGTVCGLFDEQTASYDCALKSDIHRLADWVGEYVEVTGALADVGKELPVMNVSRVRLLKIKWMR